MKHKLYIHPLTIPLFILMGFTPQAQRFYILYIFIFLHEIAHMVTSLLLKEKVLSIKLLPWGCVLSLSSIPKRKNAVLIFFSGPLFNIIMYYAGIFPLENLSLALFNLMPVLPLDGGAIVNALFGRRAFFISSSFLIILVILCIYFRLPLYFPVLLVLLLILSEKNRIDKTISAKIIGYFKKES